VQDRAWPNHPDWKIALQFNSAEGTKPNGNGCQKHCLPCRHTPMSTKGRSYKKKYSVINDADT